MDSIYLPAEHPWQPYEKECDNRCGIIAQRLPFNEHFNIMTDAFETGEYRLHTDRIGCHVDRKKRYIGTKR